MQFKLCAVQIAKDATTRALFDCRLIENVGVDVTEETSPSVEDHDS